MSALYDTAIALSTVFHMIEWLRWTAFLTTALVAANLMPIYYALTLNLPFGIVACIIAIVTRFTGDGAACADAQPTRSFYLGLQVVCLVVYLITCFAHVIYLKIRGVNWCHEQYIFEK